MRQANLFERPSEHPVRHRLIRTLRGVAAVASVAGAVMVSSGCASEMTSGPETIAINGDAFSGKLVIDSVSRTLYVATHIADDDGDPDTNVHALSVIDMSTNTVTARIPMSTYANASDIAIDSSTRTIYIVSALDRQRETGLLTIVDGETNTVTAEIPTGAYSMRVAVDQITHTAYLVNEATKTIEDAAGRLYTLTVSVVPPGARSVGAPVPVAIASAEDIVIDDASHTAYLVDNSRLEVIDLATTTKTSTILLPSSNTEIALFDTDSRTIFAVNQEGEVAIVDLATGKFTKNYEGFGRLEDSRGIRITYTAALDSARHTVYTAGNALADEDLIKAIDTDTGVVVDTWQVRQPDGVAVDPDTHTLYAFVDGDVAVYPRPEPR